MKLAAIYARVSTDRQREDHTIESQIAALIEFAKRNEFEVPKEWIFEDDGYRGATLERPGLERVRDLAAEGQIQAVLVYCPDRLSRKYAYQYLLIEEFWKHGVETRFVKAPKGDTPEEELLLQLQGMIAEYERAQIMERSRRGKRHRAKAGEVSVLSAAPYGYIYVKKTDVTPAEYRVNKSEAHVVRKIFKMYTSDGLGTTEITRRLMAQGIPNAKGSTRWGRSSAWAILRNSAYMGIAFFGKRRVDRDRRKSRTERRTQRIDSDEVPNDRRPREEWIGIPVPALISEEMFARAQERLQENKARSKRRTIVPSVSAGLVCCQKCGQAFSRRTTKKNTRTYHYYKCNGANKWLNVSSQLCDNRRSVRMDFLDEVVWNAVVKLLEDPTVIQMELDRRLEAARASDLGKDKQKALQQEITRVTNSIERLLTAYQEQLLSLDQFRDRVRPLRQREGALKSELQELVEQTHDRAAVLRLADTLTSFLDKLRLKAKSLDVLERQRIVRLLVKEILVGDDAIVIRHCIPVTSSSGARGSRGRPEHSQAKSPVGAGSLLRPRGDYLASV